MDAAERGARVPAAATGVIMPPSFVRPWRERAMMLVYTIGHSNQEIERFVELLRAHAIEVVVDVRSAPISSYCPQFDKELLSKLLMRSGVRYVFLGRELGGRPDNAEFFDERGHALYDRMAAAETFRAGIARMQRDHGDGHAALMCSEEDPRDCHRHLLLARVLDAAGVEVRHIRGDGTVQSYREVVEAVKNEGGVVQLELFPTKEADAWRSTRSVLPKKRPASFSGP
jgi:uncharacterized protein (DUF488 family)